MQRVRIIADDLTGAADTSLAFWKSGLTVQIRFADTGPQDIVGSLPPSHLVEVLSTETRNATADDAKAILGNLILNATLSPNSLLLKKIDSTLRGWVGMEIRILLDSLPERIAWIVPSYPQMGRRMENGIYTVQGIPLAATEFAGEIPNGPPDSRIVPFLEEQLGESVGFVGLDILEQSAEVIAAYVKTILQSSKTRAILFDTTSDAHIAQIVAVSEYAETLPLWVGSAGLAGALAAHVHRPSKESPPLASLRSPAPQNHPIVIVAGSRNPTTRRQIAFLKAQEPQVYHGVLWDLPRGFLEDGTVATILTPPEIDISADGIGPLEIAAQLADQARIVIDSSGSRRFILTGGDIAAATCRYLNVDALEIVGMVEEGIPLLRLRGGIAAGALAVTKAGGFGTEESLYRAFKLLQGTNE